MTERRWETATAWSQEEGGIWQETEGFVCIPPDMSACTLMTHQRQSEAPMYKSQVVLRYNANIFYMSSGTLIGL